MVRFLRDLWSGNVSITQTLVVNFLLPAICLHLVQKLFLTKWIDSQLLPKGLTIALLLVIYAALVVTTAVGLNRRVRAKNASYATGGDVAVANVVLFIGAAYFFIAVTDLVTGRTNDVSVNALVRQGGSQTADSRSQLPAFTRDSALATRLTVTGLIDSGATRRLRSVLDASRSTSSPITQLVLESVGGNIYEARGIAHLVRKHGLNTHVETQCLSACTLVFVSGAHRTAVADATFGFHAYHLDANYPQVWSNAAEEEKKDIELFALNGVDKALTAKIYAANHSSLWTPAHTELIATGFLHETIKAAPALPGVNPKF